MIAYIVRRSIQAVVILIITSVLIFAVLHLLPGDPILIYMTQSQYSAASAEQIAAVRHEFGLDRPLVMQYFTWVSDLLHGDFGKSIVKRQLVIDLILYALPKSLHLGVLSFFISIIIGIPIGIICAIRRGKWLDTILTIFANIGITAPVFCVGILLIYLFGIWLGWLPTHGYTSPFGDFGLNTKQIIMPIFCLSLFPLAAIVRQTRSAMLEVVKQDYIRTAWAKGLIEHTVILKHALKNGILPVVTLAGTWISGIFGGQVLIETVFAIPGMGSLSVDALLNQDYAVVQGIVLIVGIVVVFANLIVDISYSWLDPRIRYE